MLKKIKKLVDQAKKSIKIYKKAGNRYELKKNQYIVKKYQDRVNYDFYDTTGFQKLLDYNFSDAILIVFLFLCALPLFYQERIYGMEDMILATKKGRKTYVAGKYNFSDSSNYNVYDSDCVCELYCILHNLWAERISNAHICIRRISIFII